MPESRLSTLYRHDCFMMRSRSRRVFRFLFCPLGAMSRRFRVSFAPGNFRNKNIIAPRSTRDAQKLPSVHASLHRRVSHFPCISLKLYASRDEIITTTRGWYNLLNYGLWPLLETLYGFFFFYNSSWMTENDNYFRNKLIHFINNYFLYIFQWITTWQMDNIWYKSNMEANRKKTWCI